MQTVTYNNTNYMFILLFYLINSNAKYVKGIPLAEVKKSFIDRLTISAVSVKCESTSHTLNQQITVLFLLCLSFRTLHLERKERIFFFDSGW